MLSVKEEIVRLIEAALSSPNCVVSVMGDHAGEGADEIFNRKKTDINRLGKTFWLMRSSKARPAQVQGMCAPTPSYTIFVEPANKGSARPTTAEDAAKEYSDDRMLWHQLPEGLSPVTGKLDAGATALVFDMMTNDVRGILDLWEYGELSEPLKPLRFVLGCSTVCSVRKDTKSHPEKMKSYSGPQF